MRHFGWVAERREPPAQWDLRRAGWTLAPPSPTPSPTPPRVWLVDMRGRRADGSLANADMARCLFLGVECGVDRARLLEAGAGEALPAAIGLRELALRARRIAAARECLPRRREIGPLTLDLLHRDARSGESWLALHPREFALLWRLAEHPGERVTRARLLRDVWRLDFEPGTNSLEVHVSRLRAKLAAAGIEGLVETDLPGGYRLATPRCAPIEQRVCA